jgi:hypothetical protein
VWWPFRRRARARLHEIGESEAYGRTYGERTLDVKVVDRTPRRPRYLLRVSGEDLRRQFEEKLGKRREHE